MSAKSERIEVRTDPDTRERISRAAQERRTTFSAFILEAASSEADRVLARKDQTLMPEDQFDSLIASLDVADAAPQLAELARRPRRFTRQ